MGSDSIEPEAREASTNKRNLCSQPVRLLEKLATMNATKTELRQYNLAMIIIVDAIRSCGGRGILIKL